MDETFIEDMRLTEEETEKSVRDFVKNINMGVEKQIK